MSRKLSKSDKEDTSKKKKKKRVKKKFKRCDRELQTHTNTQVTLAIVVGS